MSSLGPVADLVDDYGDDADVVDVDAAARDYFADLAFEAARERRVGIASPGAAGWHWETEDQS